MGDVIVTSDTMGVSPWRFTSWILFFVLISADVFPVASAIILKKLQSGLVWLENFLGFNVAWNENNAILQKRRVRLVKYGVLILLVISIISGVKTIKKEIRGIYTTEPYRMLDKSNYQRCSDTTYDPYCKRRIKKSGIAEVHAFSETVLPAQIGKIAVRVSKTMPGNTAIYLPPEHPYWNFFPGKDFTGLYFMAEYGIPLIYGLNNDNPGYGYAEVQYQGGLLKSLEDIGGVAELCKTAEDVHIDNVVIFSGNALDYETVSCKEVAK